MRDQVTRDGRTGQPRLDKEIGLGDVLAATGLALLIPVVLWAVSYPVTAAGMVAVVVGAYAMIKAGKRVAGTDSWARVKGTVAERRFA